MSRLSRARNGARIALGAVASAESTRARAIIDLEPGSRTVVATGRVSVGALQAVTGPGPVGCRACGALGTVPILPGPPPLLSLHILTGGDG